MPLSRVSMPPRITLTVGVAGAGKTTLVRLFVEKWARKELYTDITCVLALGLWELNMYDRLSAERLVHLAHPCYSAPPPGALLILDGLDELRAPLDFLDSVACTDPQRELLPECLITNIIWGNLLPDSSVWVTSRTGAASRIPGGLVDRMTEISGLGTVEIKQFLEQLLPHPKGTAEKVWSHLQCHLTLQALCSVPPLCHILGVSFGFLLHNQDPSYQFLPRTLSTIFSWFLKAQLGEKECSESSGSNRKTVGNLGKLAFQGLLRGRSVFFDSDLKSSGIDTPLPAGSAYARFLMYQNSHTCTGYSFFHLSTQEFLAATYYYQAAKRAIFDLFADGGMTWPKLGFLNHYKNAVQRTLHGEGIQLTIFLRFLSGLLSPQVLRVLAVCLPGKEEPGGYHVPAADYLQNILGAERIVSSGAVNLVCCLLELGHTELTSAIEEALKNGTLRGKMSQLVCCVLSYLLRTSNSCAQEVNLSQCLSYNLVQSLLSQLQYCTNLRMENNNFQDEVMELLASILRAKDCVIHTFSLAENRVGNRGVKVLGRALVVNYTLAVLDLHSNKIGPSGAMALAEVLQSNQVLHSLNLQNNQIKTEGVTCLAQSLLVNCKLRALHIQKNHIGAEGVERLSESLKRNQALQELWLSGNCVGDRGAAALAEALKVNTTLTTLE
ncbi:hypothetical protein GDO86_017494 [Hymenochirus boettgeri]|uniref:NACHT domain-containing protein n=1 Tax=Hymenochirus boettgeri TaxID=247094 RepID=A0A8T2IQA9_9PIPI|nr:hypothetical protein GDO86_017494 [Hymenochirus boettgeri]